VSPCRRSRLDWWWLMSVCCAGERRAGWLCVYLFIFLFVLNGTGWLRVGSRVEIYKRGKPSLDPSVPDEMRKMKNIGDRTGGGAWPWRGRVCGVLLQLRKLRNVTTGTGVRRQSEHGRSREGADR
jgi:hypothetical protein